MGNSESTAIRAQLAHDELKKAGPSAHKPKIPLEHQGGLFGEAICGENPCLSTHTVHSDGAACTLFNSIVSFKGSLSLRSLVASTGGHHPRSCLMFWYFIEQSLGTDSEGTRTNPFE